MASANFDQERERLVAICAEVFAEKGFHNTSLTDLTTATKLGRGGFYHYIVSKDTLLFEIVKSQIDQLLQQAEGVRAQGLPAVDELRELARGLLVHGGTHRAGWMVFFRDFLSLTGDARTEVLEARNRYEGYWLEAVVRARAEGLVVEQPSIAVKAMLGAFNHTYLWFDTEGELSASELADSFLELFLDGMRAR